jgi:hypothetical protein
MYGEVVQSVERIVKMVCGLIGAITNQMTPRLVLIQCLNYRALAEQNLMGLFVVKRCGEVVQLVRRYVKMVDGRLFAKIIHHYQPRNLLVLTRTPKQELNVLQNLMDLNAEKRYGTVTNIATKFAKAANGFIFVKIQLLVLTRSLN